MKGLINDTDVRPYIEKDAIKQFLRELEYPLYYLDFETFNTAIPLFDGVRPYQQIPFQFSLHKVDEHHQSKHYSFLADSQEDPSPRFIEELRKVTGDEGSIVTYNQSFEQGILEELGKTFPEYRDWVKHIYTRLIDLLEPFRNFIYYHADQKGSASIKTVLPVLTGKSYDEMEISSGDSASLAYLTILIATCQRQKSRRLGPTWRSTVVLIPRGWSGLWRG